MTTFDSKYYQTLSLYLELFGMDYFQYFLILLIIIVIYYLILINIKIKHK